MHAIARRTPIALAMVYLVAQRHTHRHTTGRNWFRRSGFCLDKINRWNKHKNVPQPSPIESVVVPMRFQRIRLDLFRVFGSSSEWVECVAFFVLITEVVSLSPQNLYSVVVYYLLPDCCRCYFFYQFLRSFDVHCGMSSVKHKVLNDWTIELWGKLDSIICIFYDSVSRLTLWSSMPQWMQSIKFRFLWSQLITTRFAHAFQGF